MDLSHARCKLDQLHEQRQTPGLPSFTVYARGGGYVFVPRATPHNPQIIEFEHENELPRILAELVGEEPGTQEKSQHPLAISVPADTIPNDEDYPF